MKITVILSYYNRPVMAKRAIDSVLAQTHEDWQLIVMDDWSGKLPPIPVDLRVDWHRTTAGMCEPRGDTRALCSTVHAKQIVPRGPARMAAGINEAKRYVKGEVVCYLADDDWYHHDWLAHVNQAFTYNADVDVVWGRLRYTDAEGTPTGDERMPYGWEHPARELDHNQVAHRARLNHGAMPPWPTDMERLRRELNTDGPDAGFFYDLWKITKQWMPLPWADAAYKRIHPRSMLLQGLENVGEVREAWL